ncbi:MAG: hypothetical protein U0V70_02175 [Terriglobia bacterium]
MPRRGKKFEGQYRKPGMRLRDHRSSARREDKVIVGVTGGDAAHRGYINAFDVKTDAGLGDSGPFRDRGKKGTKRGQEIAGKPVADRRG